MRFGFLIVAVALAIPAPIWAQDKAETLADIRQELSVLYVEVQKLKRELSTTGAAGNLNAGGTALQRIDAIESELVRLTGKTEQLEFRVNSVVKDGTNRIGDLEFRLVELEGGDPATLGETTTLGGAAPDGAAPVPAAIAAQPATGGAELAVGEKADYERAAGALASGDFRSAADLFKAFGEAYPGSPLTADALLNQGEALRSLDDKTGSARAYLDAFTADPGGPNAPEALFRLGRALGELGSTQEACVTLTEVGLRFPGHAAVAQAEETKARIGCP